jgi:hypothetical protein
MPYNPPASAGFYTPGRGWHRRASPSCRAVVQFGGLVTALAAMGGMSWPPDRDVVRGVAGQGAVHGQRIAFQEHREINCS